MNAKEHLVASLPPDERDRANRILEKSFSSDGNDAVLWLFARVLDAQEDARKSVKRTIESEVATQFAEQQKLIAIIHGPHTFRKLLLNRVLFSLIIPLLVCGVILGGIYWLALNQNQRIALLTLRTNEIKESQEKTIKFQKESLSAIQAADQQAAALYTIARILNAPGADLIVQQNGLSLVLRKGTFEVHDLDPELQTIFFNQNKSPEELQKMLSDDGVDGLLKRAYQHLTHSEAETTDKPAGQK